MASGGWQVSQNGRYIVGAEAGIPFKLNKSDRFELLNSLENAPKFVESDETEVHKSWKVVEESQCLGRNVGGPLDLEVSGQGLGNALDEPEVVGP